MLFMVEKGIKGGICHAIHQYVKTNSKCLKEYDIKRIVISLVLGHK